MKNKDALIYISSVKNISKRLEFYGDANIENISLLKLIYKYSDYCSTYAMIQKLDKMVSILQRTDKDICLEKTKEKGFVKSIFNPSAGVDISSKPSVSDLTFSLDQDSDSVSLNTLFSTFSDPNGYGYSGFSFKTLPASGSLTYNGQPVEINKVYTSPDVTLYARSGESSYSESFTYAVYNDSRNLRLESNVSSITVNVDAKTTPNQPATVGDRTQVVDNRTTTVLTVADFTTRAIAPYFDPEGNELDAIRIDSIGGNNKGVLYYLDTPVVEGQIVTKSELESGALYHVSVDSDAIATDSYTMSVRDTGSMIWVSN